MVKTRALVLPISKPVSAWNKPHRWSLKALFKALAKTLTRAVGGAVAGAGAGAATGSLTNALLGGAAGALVAGAPSVASDFFDAATTSEPRELTPEELAWVLIQRALSEAAGKLVLETSLELARIPTDSDALSTSLETLLDRLEKTAFELNASFFRRPGDLPLLAELRAPFRRLLMDHGIGETAAKLAVDGLRQAFVLALHEEWRRRPADYEKLKAAVETPFMEASEQELAWERYAACLRAQINERIFGDELKLAHVYVWPRAYWLEEMGGGSPRRRRSAFASDEAASQRGSRKRGVVVSLLDELDGWIEQGDPANAVRVIAGGPGAGKSSFATMFAAHRSARGDRVLLILLHELHDPARDLEWLVGDYVRRGGYLPQNPLGARAGEERLLLIFDGLDELSMQGRAASEMAKDFVREVIKLVGIRNRGGLRLQAILDGREVVVQACEGELRNKPGQVLHLLPYFVREEERRQWLEGEGWEDPHGLLNVDQRDEWWRGYHAMTGRGQGGFPRELARPELDEITAQPLLSYLLAIARANGKLDFTRSDINRNAIYEDLVRAVYDRHYAGGSPHPEVKDLSYKHFVLVLEEVGLAAWHGDGRTATIPEIERRCEASGVLPLLQKLKTAAVSGATRLLAAFHFRRRGERGGHDTFELTHKSFGEYLVARRLARALRKMEQELRGRRDAFDGGWDERGALAHWAALCGPSPMAENLLRFLCDEVALDGEEAAVRGQAMIGSLLSVVMRSGMPMEKLQPRLPTFHEDVRQACNAEEALLAAHWAFAHVTRKVGAVEWPDAWSAGRWLTRLRHQRAESAPALALRCLGYLKLAGCALQKSDLFEANLTGADLSGANLGYATLTRAQLVGANLTNADLGGAELRNANLMSAHLMGAFLNGADLLGANLAGANLTGADLATINPETVDLSLSLGTPWGLPGEPPASRRVR